MKLRHRGLIGLVALLLAWVVRVWMNTVRYRLYFMDGRRHPVDFRQERFIYAFWHEALLLPTKYKTRIHILISQHADGEAIARVCGYLGFRVVRGSTNRGGTRALMELVQRSRDSHLAITPDGPRGPRRQAQMGLVYLASLTGLQIIPIGIACQRAWRAPSWDQMLLPKPWSTAHGVVGLPIPVPAKLDRVALEPYRLLVENALVDATHAAELWARTGRYPASESPAAESPKAQMRRGVRKVA